MRYVVVNVNEDDVLQWGDDKMALSESLLRLIEMVLVVNCCTSTTLYALD
jgi:hypothetical protein